MIQRAQAKKDLALVFNNLLRRQAGSRYPTVEYIYKSPDILDNLVKGYALVSLSSSPPHFTLPFSFPNLHSISLPHHSLVPVPFLPFVLI